LIGRGKKNQTIRPYTINRKIPKKEREYGKDASHLANMGLKNISEGRGQKKKYRSSKVVTG